MKGPFGFVVLMALLFAGSIGYLLWVILLPALEVRSWVATPCEINFSEERSTGRTRRARTSFSVVYSYSHGGRNYTGNRSGLESTAASRGLFWGEWESRVRSLVAENPAGKRTTCYVNPNQPAESILDKSIPMTPPVASHFVFIGAAGYGLFRSLRRRRAILREFEVLPGNPSSKEV